MLWLWIETFKIEDEDDYEEKIFSVLSTWSNPANTDSEGAMESVCID